MIFWIFVVEPSALDRQVAAQLGHVAGGLHVVLGFGDLALLVNDECRANHALHGLAVHLLFAVGAVGRQHLALGVRQQRKRQAFGITELGQLLWLVGGDADDIEAGSVELAQVVAEVAGLLGASRRRGRRVEVDDHAMALVVGERDLLAVGARKGEGGRFVARRKAFVVGQGAAFLFTGRWDEYRLI